MIVFPNTRNITPELQKTFKLSLRHIGRGFDALCFRNNDVILVTWDNGKVNAVCHQLLYNIVTTYPTPEVSETMLSALSEIAKGEEMSITGRKGLMVGVDGDEFFEKSHLYAPGRTIIPIFQAIQNERIDGDKVQQSLAILYDMEIPFKIIRIYLNGGLKVQRKTEASPATSFEDLVTYLFSSRES